MGVRNLKISLADPPVAVCANVRSAIDVSCAKTGISTADPPVAVCTDYRSCILNLDYGVGAGCYVLNELKTVLTVLTNAAVGEYTVRDLNVVLSDVLATVGIDVTVEGTTGDGKLLNAGLISTTCKSDVTVERTTADVKAYVLGIVTVVVGVDCKVVITLNSTGKSTAGNVYCNGGSNSRVTAGKLDPNCTCTFDLTTGYRNLCICVVSEEADCDVVLAVYKTTVDGDGALVVVDCVGCAACSRSIFNSTGLKNESSVVCDSIVSIRRECKLTVATPVGIRVKSLSGDLTAAYGILNCKRTIVLNNS